MDCTISPKAMTDLAKVVANHSVNTLVSRMRGHFETDRSVLKRTVRWEQWLADAEADLALAQKLGGKVVLMGHSTGALLLTVAIRNPDKIAGLILFSPAFGVHSFAQAGAWASYLTKIVSRNRRRQSKHGPLGLGSRPGAAAAFRAWLIASSRDGRPYTYASEQLKDVLVWMANTAADTVI